MPGQRLRPPIPFPVEFKPFLKVSRIRTSELAGLRRAIEADDSFRSRLGTGAVPELVDDIGREWLQRTEGWQERIAALVERAAGRGRCRRRRGGTASGREAPRCGRAGGGAHTGGVDRGDRTVGRGPSRAGADSRGGRRRRHRPRAGPTRRGGRSNRSPTRRGPGTRRDGADVEAGRRSRRRPCRAGRARGPAGRAAGRARRSGPVLASPPTMWANSASWRSRRDGWRPSSVPSSRLRPARLGGHWPCPVVSHGIRSGPARCCCARAGWC